MFHLDLAPFGADNARLKQQRLERLQAAMRQQGLAALMLTDHFNIRYATDTVFMYDIRATGIQRFVLVPLAGAPLIVERDTPGIAPTSSARTLGAYMFSMRPASATQDFVAQTAGYLREMGIGKEPVGVDVLNLDAVDAFRSAGIRMVDGWRALHQARSVKTANEIELIRWATRAKERGMDMIRQALHQGDIREDKLSRIMMDSLLDEGCEAGSEFMAIYDSSKEKRPHTEPGGTDMVVVEGDLVICDAPMASPGGYYSDFARTFSRGKPTAACRTRYREAYETLQAALPMVKPGPCTELFSHFGKHASKRMPGLDGFHGVGLCLYEAPWLRGGDPEGYGVTLEENMIIALEINHNPVKLEHLLRVTATGVEILSTYPMDQELVAA